MNSGLAAKIAADAVIVKTLATDFANASAAAAPGVCSQLQGALGVYQADQQQVLQLAQVSDTNTQAKITLLVGLSINVFSIIVSLIPSCQKAALARAERRAAVTEPPMPARIFVVTYNNIMVAKTGNLVVDNATHGLQIHQHGKATRILTLGYAK